MIYCPYVSDADLDELGLTEVSCDAGDCVEPFGIALAIQPLELDDILAWVDFVDEFADFVGGEAW